MNQKNLVALLIVIIIILIGTTVYFATSKNKDETMKWKVYKNSAVGFSIKYPNNWPVKQPESNDCGEGKICEVVFGNLPKDYADTSNLINLLVHSPEAIKGNNGDGSANCKNYQEVTLTSGLSAEKKQCVNDMDGSLQYIYTIKKNGWWYQIISHKGEQAEKVLEGMANSFSFTN